MSWSLLSNPTGPRIVSGNSPQWGRSPNISPGTSSTRRIPGGRRGQKNMSCLAIHADNEVKTTGQLGFNGPAAQSDVLAVS